MDCKKLFVYGLVILVGLYLLKDICGLKTPSVEGMADFLKSDDKSMDVASQKKEALPSDPSSFKEASMNKEVPVCKRQEPLSPKDLLPTNEESKTFNSQNPDGEGILKGVNYLEATFHAGVNTVGQSLRNANLNLRAEPPNPRVMVSPWMNSTIDADLSRKPLSDNLS